MSFSPFFAPASRRNGFITYETGLHKNASLQIYPFYFRIPKKIAGQAGNDVILAGRFGDDMLWLEDLTVDDRTAEGEFVGIFQVITEAESAGKRRYLDPVSGYLAINVE